ncbi:MAG: polyprenyl synthetase family protein [Muribaculaceae bacterium]|nr:polyprenyl synthetase family protein [Muribaculaceae bacterium]
MIKLNNIQNTISKELSALNEIIVKSLGTDSLLMKEVVKGYLATKGKQIRPILVILSAKAFGNITDKVLNAAAAIEMLHNASLIHDDVVDDSKCRRGSPTINSIWDNHVAVLVGDFFVSRALKCAIDTGDIRIIESISELGSELSMGEIDQIDNARSHLINEEKYYDIITKKTASLFRSCVAVGGYAVNAGEEDITKLRKYAELLGICFQIKDDIFDYYDDKVVGKPTGNDLKEGKITLPLLYSLSLTDIPECAAMQALVNKESLNDEEIDTLIEFAKNNGGIDYAYNCMEDIRNRANLIIDDYPQSDALDALRSIFDYIIERNN